MGKEMPFHPDRCQSRPHSAQQVSRNLRTEPERTCVLRRQLRILQAAERTATERPATTTGRERKRTPPNTETGTRSSRTKRKAEYTERKISA